GQSFGDIVAAQSLLLRGEGESLSGALAPGEDLAVHNQWFGEGTERRRQLGKRSADLIERAREQPHGGIVLAAAVSLGANAVILVFDGRMGEVREGFMS